MTKTDFWKQSSAELFAELASSNDGLTSHEATSRLLRYGNNDATAPKRASAWLRFTRRFANPLVLVLLLASALSAATGDVASFFIVATIVVLSVLLDFVQESRTQSAVDALREQVALRADVRRDGAETGLPVAQLVPGDIVRLTAGDLVPADGVLLTSRDFFVNQALLTGESYPVEKHTAEQGNPVAEISDPETWRWPAPRWYPAAPLCSSAAPDDKPRSASSPTPSSQSCRQPPSKSGCVGSAC
jgi:P-type Mg2+ transporter